MKKTFIFLFAVLSLMVSCTPENKQPTVEVPPKEEEIVKDPYEESPLGSISVTPDIVTKDLHGTWLMGTGGNITDKLIICLDEDGVHKAVHAEKEGQLLLTMTTISNQVIYQLWISDYVQYEPLAYAWNGPDSIKATYTDKNTGNKTSHSMYKYSDSFIDETAFDDASALHGLWVDAGKSKGLRFLPDGVLLIYKGNSSEKCKWKDGDENALLVMDSFGFSEKVPFVKIGDNMLVYKGEKYYRTE